MDSQILRLLIISLFVTVSFCLFAPLAEFNGTLPSYPKAQVLAPFNFNGFPGPAIMEIQAVSTVIVCVTPNAFISSNLATNCPNPIYFAYNNPASPMNEFLLFLDDFSMNFLGQEAQNQYKRPQSDIAPYTPQNTTVSLLQNTNYYISIGLAEDVGNNETLAYVEDFVLQNEFSQCLAGTVPNIGYNGINGEPCQEIKSALNPTNSSSPPLFVSQKNSLVISFDVVDFSYAAQLDFHVIDRNYNFTIYFGFDFVPTSTNFDFTYSNSSSGANLIEEDFLVDIVQSFSVVIPNPKTGTYYALITSNLKSETSFHVEFNTSLCNPGLADCGTYNVTTFSSSDTNVTNITLTNAIQYLAVVGENVIFGIDVNNAGNAFIQMDINALPSGKPQTSDYQYNISTNLTLNFQTPQEDNFVFGLLNADTVSQDAFTALVWTGSACPGNCSSQGSCDATTTLCTCNSGFNGRYCQSKSSSKKKLSTLYIILIIIGGAILLAILIGVPVALFLNNRKKARYERV